MSGIDDIFLLIAVVTYIVLGLTIGILVSMRKYKKSAKHSYLKKKQPLHPHENGTLIVNGQYELRTPPYKQGGMATIWFANERKTGSNCIIKTPRRGTMMDNVYLDKLILEARFLKKLEHPGIVKYLNDFYYKDEFHLVLEYLAGDTMLAISPRSPFGEQQVIDWACQVLSALSYIHSKGIVHRDVNPKNIMLCNDGTIKLIDFGTAKNIDEIDKEKPGHDPFTQITNKGFDIPELFTGEETDQRCDLCGLAQTCIYLLTLNQPNDICSNLIKSSWPRTYSEAKTVADYLVSAGVSSRTAKCLAQGILFDAGKRFESAKAMRAALSLVDGYPIKSEVLPQK